MSKHSLSLTMEVSVVLLLLTVTVSCMGDNSNADGHVTTAVKVKPNENACLKCPIRRIPGNTGINWKHGENVIFRDYIRRQVDKHLQVSKNTCSEPYETLELVNASKSVNHAKFTCWNKSVLAATFEIDVKGIPNVKIMIDNRMISTLLNVQPGSNETLQCDVNDAIAPFNITWAINGTVNRTNTEEDDTHLTSNLSIHLIDSPLLITCQVTGLWISKVFANISIIPVNVDEHTTDKNDDAFVALCITVPVLFLASIFTSVGLYRRMQRHSRNSLNIKPPSRQTNSDDVDTVQGMTVNPVYDDVSDNDENPNKDSPADNVNAQDDYHTTLAICLKTSRMFEYWSARYTKGENKDVKCFAKTLSGSATMNDARSFQELAIALNSLRAHSSIVKLLCISVDELPYSIFYEQLDGGSLRDFMMTHYQGARESHAASTGTGNQDFLQEKMKMELQELIYFALNINKGLRFLSGQKFCHPALCLKKVLLSSIGQCKLYDICPLSSAMRKVEELMKKERPPIAWIPPETIFMQEYYQASDVWGFAVLLWELFSFGEIPLARVSDSDIEKQIRGGFILPQPLCCPGAVYGIMLSSWSNRKRERPNFSAIATKLKNMVTKLQQREQPPLPAERNQDTTESHPVTDVQESAHSTSYFVLESKFQTNDYV
ncbi:uncharacterized protein [Apostichopus japonicus]|uniref:uncharacterized protein n=1 Tax=Stichopus japonicus TaxID=307972 RepID=UPI003AB4D781